MKLFAAIFSNMSAPLRDNKGSTHLVVDAGGVGELKKNFFVPNVAPSFIYLVQLVSYCREIIILRHWSSVLFPWFKQIDK
jgi:hypothetical protein